MAKHKRTKALAPSQELFEAMNGDVSSAASAVEDVADVQLFELPADDAADVADDPAQAETPAQDDAPAAPENLSGASASQPADDPGLMAEVPVTKVRRATMENVALVFLEDAVARRLAVAWPVCGGNEEEWLDAAGFTAAQRAPARSVGRALRLHGICRDGGITDELALQYIRAITARPLASTAKKKP